MPAAAIELTALLAAERNAGIERHGSALRSAWMASLLRPEFVRCRSGQTISQRQSHPPLSSDGQKTWTGTSQSGAANVHFQTARYRVHLQNLS
jgi:hypothetical protein